MKPVFSLIGLISATSLPALHAASVTVDTGGGSVVVFETSTGDALNGGTMFIGRFDVAPSLGISHADVLANFVDFGALSATSGAFGNFTGEAVVGTAVPDFFGDQIYLVVTDTSSIAAATQFAVVSSSSLDWLFPDDGSIVPNSDLTTTSLPDIDQYYAGSPDTFDIDGPGDTPAFNSVQLVAVPEPASSLLVLGSALMLGLRRRRS